MTGNKFKLEEIMLFGQDAKIETMKSLPLTEKRCEGGRPHKFEQLYGGRGGQKCTECGRVVGAISEEEYFEKLFEKGGPSCS